MSVKIVVNSSGGITWETNSKITCESFPPLNATPNTLCFLFFLKVSLMNFFASFSITVNAFTFLLIKILIGIGSNFPL